MAEQEQATFAMHFEDVSNGLEWIKKCEMLISNVGDTTENYFELKNSFSEETLGFLQLTPEQNLEELLKCSCVCNRNQVHLNTAGYVLKWAKEVLKNDKLLCEIEIITRGILAKDTKKWLPLFLDYLKFYASRNPNFINNRRFYISREVPICLLGAFLGMSVFNKHHILLYCEPEISLTVRYLIDLAIKAGFPSGFFKLKIVDNISAMDKFIKHFYINCFEATINCPVPKKSLCYGTPMIVFENADINSSTDSIMDAAWSYRGMAPWTLKIVFIQDSIFKNFISLLKTKLDKMHVGNANIRNMDVSFPLNTEDLQTKFHGMRENAEAAGLEVHSIGDNNGKLFPTLFIGGNIFDATDNCNKLPILSVVSFKTKQDAINLMNETQFDFAASIWTKNWRFANDLAEKLNFSYIWINSFGLFTPSLCVESYKNPNNWQIGGLNCLSLYWKSPYLKCDSQCSAEHDVNLENFIGKVKEAQKTWSKCSRIIRCRLLISLWRQIHSQLILISPDILFAFVPFEVILTELMFMDGTSGKFNGFNTKSKIIPWGILLFDGIEQCFHKYIYLLITSLMEGNTVIQFYNSNDRRVKSLFEKMMQNLPNHVFTFLECSCEEHVKAVAAHKDVAIIFSDFYLEPGLMSKLKSPNYAVKTNFDCMTRCKTVWSKSAL